MPKRFAATESAIEKGLESVTPAAGAKLVEAWIDELNKADFSGAKGIAGDLERLHKALTKDEVDGDRVKELVAKLGEATTKAASRADGATAPKVEELGKALTDA